MSSTISSVNESLVDSKVVKALRYVLPMLNAFSHVFEQQGRIQNDVLYVPIATDPSAGSKTAGTMKSADGTLAGKSITLDAFSAAGWDAKEGQMRKDLFAEYWADKTAGAVYGVAKTIVDDMVSLVTAANFGDVDADKHTVAEADFDTRNLGIIAKKAAVKIKQREKTLVLNAGHSFALLGQSTLGMIYAFGGDNVLESGQVPPLMGMPTIKYDAFNAAGTENLVGMVCGKAALLLGIAPPDPLAAGGQGNIVERRIITDPESGASVLYTMTADGGGLISGEVAVLYGKSVGQNAIVRILSA